VVVVIGILMSIALPAINGVRESARNSDCMNRMRQLGMGLQVYESRTGSFPPASTPAAAGSPDPPEYGRHHVLTFILPYLELDFLSDNIDLGINWNTGDNKAIADKDVYLFLCPSAPERIGDKATDYTVAYGIDDDLYEEFALVGYSGTEDALQESLLQLDIPTSTASIRDGLGSTFMMVERAGLPYSYEQGRLVGTWNTGRQRWAGYTTPFPITDLDCGIYQFINCKNRQEIYSFHPEGAVFLYGDGAAKFESEAMSPAVFANRITRAGGEVEFRE